MSESKGGPAYVLQPLMMTDGENETARSGRCPACAGAIIRQHVSSEDGALVFAQCVPCNRVYVLNLLTAIPSDQPRAAPSKSLEVITKR